MYPPQNAVEIVPDEHFQLPLYAYILSWEMMDAGPGSLDSYGESM